MAKRPPPAEFQTFRPPDKTRIEVSPLNISAKSILNALDAELGLLQLDGVTMLMQFAAFAQPRPKLRKSALLDV